MTGLNVHVGGVHFRGYADADMYGYWIGEGGWEGWDSSPDSKSETVEYPTAHGATDVPQFLTAREVVMRGVFRASTEPVLARMSRVLSSMLGDGRSSVMSVQYAGRSTWGRVRRGLTAPDVSTVSIDDLHIGQFELTFRLADPRIFGDDRVFPATPGVPVGVFHRGTFPAHPVIEVPSAPSAYTVTSPAGTFTVAGATSGGTHRIDMRTGRVTRNGVWMPGIGSGPLWAVPDGLPMPHTLSVAGRVLIRDVEV